MNSPTTMSERLTCVEHYLRTSRFRFQASVVCFKLGMLIKHMEIESESRPHLREFVSNIASSVYALLAMIDTNGPDENQTICLEEALSCIAALRQYMFVNKLI